MLHIQLFGDVQIYHKGAPIPLIRRRLQALLAFLLLHRHSLHSREHVAAQLWLETNDAQARTNLRKELMYLRQALPDYHQFIYDDNGYLGWRSDTPFSVDLIEFESAIYCAELASKRHDETSAIIALEQASNLYRGELLINIDYAWCVLPRLHMAEHYMTGLERLIHYHRKQGDYQQALHYARKLLHYDPLHEPVYRHLMAIYAQNGDYASVQRVYQNCVALFQREFSTLPSPVTRGVYQSILG